MPVCFPEGLLLFCQLLGLREGGVHHGEGLQRTLREQFNMAITKLPSNSPGKWQRPVLPVLSTYCAAGWGYTGRICTLWWPPLVGTFLILLLFPTPEEEVIWRCLSHGTLRC